MEGGKQKVKSLKALKLTRLKLLQRVKQLQLERLQDDKDAQDDAELIGDLQDSNDEELQETEEQGETLASAADATRNTLKVGVSYGESCIGPCIYDGTSVPTCKTRPHGTFFKSETAQCVPDYVARSGGKYGVSADPARPCFSTCDSSGLCLDEHSDEVKCMDTSQVQRLVSSFASTVNAVTPKHLFKLAERGAQSLALVERRIQSKAMGKPSKTKSGKRILDSIRFQMHEAENAVQTASTAFGNMIDFFFHTMVGRTHRFKQSAMSTVLMWVTQAVSMMEDIMQLMMEYYGDPTNDGHMSDIIRVKKQLVELQESSRKTASEGDFTERRALGDVLGETFGGLARKAYGILDHWAFKVAIVGFAMNVIFQKLNTGDTSFTFGSSLQGFRFTRMSIDNSTSWLVRNNAGWLLSPIVGGSWDYILQVLFVTCMMFFDDNDPRAIATRHILIYGWVRNAIQWVDSKTLGKLGDGVVGSVLGNPALRLALATAVYVSITKLMDTMGRFACQFIMHMRKGGFANMQKDKVWTAPLHDSWFGNLLDYKPTITQPLGDQVSENIMVNMLAKLPSGSDDIVSKDGGLDADKHTGLFKNMVRSGAAVARLAKEGAVGQWVSSGEDVQAAVLRYIYEGEDQPNDSVFRHFVGTRKGVLAAGMDGARRIKYLAKLQKTYTFGADDESQDLKEELTATIKGTNGARVGIDLKSELDFSEEEVQALIYGGASATDDLSDAQVLAIRKRMGSQDLVQQFVTNHKSALETFKDDFNKGQAESRLAALQSIMTQSSFANNPTVRGSGDGATVEDLSANSVFASLVEGGHSIVNTYAQMELEAMKQADSTSSSNDITQTAIDTKYIALWRQHMRGSTLSDPLVRDMHFRSREYTLQGLWQMWGASGKGDGSVVQKMSSQQYLDTALKVLDGAMTFKKTHEMGDGWNPVDAISTQAVVNHAQNSLKIDNVVKRFANKAFDVRSFRRPGSFARKTETVQERRIRELLSKNDELANKNKRLATELQDSLDENNRRKAGFRAEVKELEAKLKGKLSEEERERVLSEIKEAKDGVRWMEEQKRLLKLQKEEIESDLNAQNEANMKLEDELAAKQKATDGQTKALKERDKELLRLQERADALGKEADAKEGEAAKLQSRADAAEARATEAEQALSKANESAEKAEDAASAASDRVKELKENGASESDVRRAIADRDARIKEANDAVDTAQSASEQQLNVLRMKEEAAAAATQAAEAAQHAAEKLREQAEVAAAEAQTRADAALAEVERLQEEAAKLLQQKKEMEDDVGAVNDMVKASRLSEKQHDEARVKAAADLALANEAAQVATARQTQLQKELVDAQSARNAALAAAEAARADVGTSNSDKTAAEEAALVASQKAAAALAERDIAVQEKHALAKRENELIIKVAALEQRIAADELVASHGEVTDAQEVSTALEQAGTLPINTGDALVESHDSWAGAMSRVLDERFTGDIKQIQENNIREIIEMMRATEMGMGDAAPMVELPEALQTFDGYTANKVRYSDAFMAYFAADFKEMGSMSGHRGQVMLPMTGQNTESTAGIGQLFQKVVSEKMSNFMEALVTGDDGGGLQAAVNAASIGNMEIALESAGDVGFD